MLFLMNRTNRTIIIKMMVDAFIVDSMSFGQTKAFLH